MADRAGIAIALVAAVLWGVSYTINQRLLTSLTPWTLMTVGALAVLIVAGPVAVWQGGHGSVLLLPSEMRWLLALDLVVGIGAVICIYYAIDMEGASRAALIEISYPVFTVIGCWVWLKEPVDWRVIAGGLLMLMGSAIIASRPSM